MVESEKTLSARRYAVLLEIAEAAANTLDKNNNPFSKQQLRIIMLDYSVSSLEAFVNHMVYIFIDDWTKYEGLNFFQQYQKMIIIFIRLGIPIPSKQETTPFDNYDVYRSIRNEIHHIRASKHDVGQRKKVLRAEIREQRIGLI
jgi:hypothetical protein